MSDETKLDTWALVELFGHQKIVGKVTESSIAGGAFLRVDVPAFNGAQAFTRFYGPGAIYSINPVSEDVARGLADRYRNEPVNAYEFPKLTDKVQEHLDIEREDGRDREDDDERDPEDDHHTIF